VPWEQANERLESQPTANIEGLVGGYTGPGGKTVLPHKAVAKMDFRLVPDMKAADALTAIKTHLAKRGFGDIEVNMTGGYDPTATLKDSALIQAQSGNLQKIRNRRVALAAQCRLVSGICLHRRTAQAGRGPFRTRPRQRRTCARRILHHRIHKPEDPRLRCRDDVVRRISIRIGEVTIISASASVLRRRCLKTPDGLAVAAAVSAATAVWRLTSANQCITVSNNENDCYSR